MKTNKFFDLFKNQDGVSVLEFGLISPALFLMLMGTFDVGHTFYMQSVINGAMRDAGRASSLEGAAAVSQQSIIDNDIKKLVEILAPDATVNINRRYYKTFSDAALAEAEEWTDTDNDGDCNNGEPYVDENVNGTWDADGGNDGQGGARDVVIITAEVTYERLFPMYGLLGFSNNITFISDSILANQPYGDQLQYETARVEYCS